MINDGTTGGASNNVWIGTQTSPATNPTITIPVGVFGVSEVWTLIDSELATPGSRAAELIFNFGTTSNATSVSSVTLKLNNSAASATPAGEVQNAVDCLPASSCSTLASGPLASSTSIAVGGAASGSVVVDTNTVYSSSYNNGPLGSYSTAGGTVALDDQGIVFNDLGLTGALAGLTNQNSYLVSIEVENIGVAGSSSALSAITLETVPEPSSTVLLILSGLGVFGFSRFRRRKVS
jgi:hypothetical protein